MIDVKEKMNGNAVMEGGLCGIEYYGVYKEQGNWFVLVLYGL